MKICQENPDFVKTGQNHGALYMKVKVCFFVASDIKLP
jgi:hypothetical protein